MNRCAFLSMANLNAFECYDHLLYEPLKKVGWLAEPVPWRNATNWDVFDAVIVRSPWDYQDDPNAFMNVLEGIQASSARLENSLPIVQWNIDKTYLKQINNKGIPIVPTQWKKRLDESGMSNLFHLFESNGIIIKPVVSANADNTFRLDASLSAQTKKELIRIFSNRPCMVQPFMTNIVDEGEFSLFYFGGHYSHAILKTPKPTDFRVQEEHGGQLQGVEPTDALRKIGRRTMQALPETPLYARVDFVRAAGQSFNLMEIELIEPSLYFNMDADSPARFARYFNEWMNNRSM